ncbi:hypothetical protein NXX73_11915 [Bacteroides fragilis]|nr:hypothetical protein [Bacteroides fragilis]
MNMEKLKYIIPILSLLFGACSSSEEAVMPEGGMGDIKCAIPGHCG